MPDSMTNRDREASPTGSTPATPRCTSASAACCRPTPTAWPTFEPRRGGSGSGCWCRAVGAASCRANPSRTHRHPGTPCAWSGTSITTPCCRGAVPRIKCPGGAGSVAAGLRAGLPTLVTWVGADQPIWGRALSSARVGATLPMARVTQVADPDTRPNPGRGHAWAIRPSPRPAHTPCRGRAVGGRHRRTDGLDTGHASARRVILRRADSGDHGRTRSEPPPRSRFADRSDPSGSHRTAARRDASRARPRSRAHRPPPRRLPARSADAAGTFAGGSSCSGRTAPCRSPSDAATPRRSASGERRCARPRHPRRAPCPRLRRCSGAC